MASSSSKPLPPLSELVSFGNAVAGHDGTMSDPDGELFIKPCTEPEIQFYLTAIDQYPRLATIIPEFYGTLSLDETKNPQDVDPTPAATIAPIVAHVKDNAGPVAQREWAPGQNRAIEARKAIVLKNTTSGFRKPNILDCKMGVRLWDDDAPQAKRDHFDIITESTTHKSHGFRIAGMHVYKGSDKAEELNETGYRIYDKYFGRSEVQPDTIVDALAKFVYQPGIGADLGEALCNAFSRELATIEEVLSETPLRMYSGSVLFVYEGDAAALAKAIETNNAEIENEETDTRSAKKRRLGADEAEPKDKGKDKAVAMTMEEVTECRVVGDTDEDEENDEDDEEHALPPIFSVKLIDFAHSNFVPLEQGPDENLLKGVKNLRAIFEQLGTQAAKHGA